MSPAKPDHAVPGARIRLPARADVPHLPCVVRQLGGAGYRAGHLAGQAARRGYGGIGQQAGDLLLHRGDVRRAGCGHVDRVHLVFHGAPDLGGDCLGSLQGDVDVAGVAGLRGFPRQFVESRRCKVRNPRACRRRILVRGRVPCYSSLVGRLRPLSSDRGDWQRTQSFRHRAGSGGIRLLVWWREVHRPSSSGSAGTPWSISDVISAARSRGENKSGPW